jgi:hypothetical protein
MISIQLITLIIALIESHISSLKNSISFEIRIYACQAFTRMKMSSVALLFSEYALVTWYVNLAVHFLDRICSLW